jgi:predicted Zn-dependent peptidase
VTNPPTEAEIDAARRHLLGRDLSAAQSNAEIADRLARQFVETGGLRSHSDLAAALESIRPADIAAAAAAFGRGTILRVDVVR